MLPSLQEQQDKFDSMTDKDKSDVSSPNSTPMYDYSSIKVKVVEKVDEIRDSINAMMLDMHETKEIGLDAEWNYTSGPHNIPSHQSAVLTIQIAYRNSDNVIQVIIIKTGKLKTLPVQLKSLLCSKDIAIAGVKVSGDLIKIGKDFNVAEIKELDQKSRSNVYNLGPFAKDRDVVQDARTVSLELLAARLLGLKVDKTLQTSDWTVPTPDQIKYAAIDAAISLEEFEVLKAMPDLCRDSTWILF